MIKFILLFFSVFFLFQSYAQQKQGSWQDYLSYTKATKIAISSDKVFCASEGGLFYFDLQDNSLNKFSDLIELSDFGVETIAYSEENKVLVVAYQNSNVDLVYENRVVNLSDIKRKQITSEKTIHNISFIGSDAYLSCGFGVVVVNLEKQEIKDSYIFGEGATLGINDVETDGYYIYAATNKGIYKAVFEGTNLPDFRNWEQVENIPNSNSKFSFLAFHAGNMIANYTPDEWDGDKMYRLDGTNWNDYLPQIRYLNDLQTNGKYMVATSREEIFLIDENNSILGRVNRYQLEDGEVSPIQTKSAGITDSGVLFIADFKNALVKVSGENYESVFPNGPIDNEIFSLLTSGSDLWVSTGGYNSGSANTYKYPQFQHYGNQEWTFFNKSIYPELDGFFDVVCTAVDPSDPEHVFVGSWGGGVLEFRGDQFLNRYTNKNSPLQTALPQNPDAPYVRIGGMDFDSQGNLWISNSTVKNNLLKLTPGGEWEAFYLPEIATNLNVSHVIVTQNDDKWMMLPRQHDAYVVDKTGDRKKRLLVTSYFNNGENEIFNRMSDIYSVVEDNEGAIWIGTSKGVAVYNNPYRIWDTDNFYAIQPSLDLNDGLYHPLLETETVTAIAVDGANRKWLGTQNSGIYLVSESGEEEVLHFTTSNSPLYSNNITSIAINQKSGEVYIGTSGGLISYMGEAIGGLDSYENVFVYPNPIRETYDGPVTVTGLIENTEVKITDISGNLVFRTTSLGGQAIWDGRNLNGNRVKTGVYLVFCNDELGEETHIEKLLFIH